MNEIHNKIKIDGATWRMSISINGIQTWRLCYATSEGFVPVVEDDEELMFSEGLYEIKKK